MLLAILLFVHVKYMLHLVPKALLLWILAMSTELVEVLVPRSTTLHSMSIVALPILPQVIERTPV